MDSIDIKLKFCRSLLNKNDDPPKLGFVSLKFYEYIATIENEIIINDRILVELIMCENEREKILLYERLYQIKKALYINMRQCEILKTRFTYNMDYSLNNLNLINYQKVVDKIERNVRTYYQMNVRNILGANFGEEEAWFMKSSIRAILTPMYS